MDGVTVQAGAVSLAIPLHRLRRVADAGTPQPFPLGGRAVEGIATIDGHPVLQAALTALLAPPDTIPPPATGNKLVVIDTGAGPMALRVDAIRAGLQGDAADADLLERLAPWADRSRPVLLPAPSGGSWSQTADAGIPLLFVRCGGAEAALPAASILAVARIDGAWEQQDGHFLLRLEDRLTMGRRLIDMAPPGRAARTYALLPRNGGGAWMVDAVAGMRRVPARSCHRVTGADGGGRHWWVQPDDGPPVRLLLAGSALARQLSGSPPDTAGTAQTRAVLVRRGELRFTLPPDLVAGVDPWIAGAAPGPWDALSGVPAGTPAHHLLRLVGEGDGLMPADAVGLVPLPAVGTWHPLPVLPPSAGRHFQAMARIDGAWVLLSRRHPRPGPAPASQPDNPMEVRTTDP